MNDNAFRRSFSLFFERNPAWIFSFSALFGALLAFHIFSPVLLAIILIVLSKKWKEVIGVLLLFFLYVSFFFSLPTEDLEGKFRLRILSKKEAKRKGWVYQAKILSFEESHLARGLICYLYCQNEKETDRDYLIDGTLIKKGDHFYSLKAKEWEPAEKHFSLVERRHKAKKWVEEYLGKVIPFERAAGFLSGLTTGQIQDRVLNKEFERRGLSHLLAISGFHFSLMALCFQFLLRPFFSYKWRTIFLLVLLSGYFLFIGNSPSVSRAWMMSSVMLCGLLFQRKSCSLNTLGIALFIALLLNPLLIFHGGFVLSYLATGGILFLYSPLERTIRLIFQSQKFVPKFFRESVSLGVAVHFAIVLHLFAMFHRFPVQGLFYNLFFPFLVTLSLFMLVFGMVLHLICPPLGLFLHQVNGYYTMSVLKLLDGALIPHHTIYVKHVPEIVLTVYMACLFFGGIWLRSYFEKRDEHDRLEFCYFDPHSKNSIL